MTPVGGPLYPHFAVATLFFLTVVTHTLASTELPPLPFGSVACENPQRSASSPNFKFKGTYICILY